MVSHLKFSLENPNHKIRHPPPTTTLSLLQMVSITVIATIKRNPYTTFHNKIAVDDTPSPPEFLHLFLCLSFVFFISSMLSSSWWAHMIWFGNFQFMWTRYVAYSSSDDKHYLFFCIWTICSTLCFFKIKKIEVICMCIQVLQENHGFIFTHILFILGSISFKSKFLQILLILMLIDIMLYLLISFRTRRLENHGPSWCINTTTPKWLSLHTHRCNHHHPPPPTYGCSDIQQTFLSTSLTRKIPKFPLGHSRNPLSWTRYEIEGYMYLYIFLPSFNTQKHQNYF